MATILLQNVGASTLSFTQKLSLAAGSANYPTGTVFDCTAYTNQSITTTIPFTRPNNTFIFGGGVFSYTPSSGSMFEISAQGITIIGTNRNARDVGSPSGTTSFTMGGSTGMGYHINYKVTAVPAGSVKGDCLVVRNCSFKGAQSVYTQDNGNVQYTTQGGGGFLITESNPGLSGQNVNNVIIDNVLIDGAKQHGIFIYGAVACKITNTRVRNAAGHGFYIDGEGTSTSFDTCYASGNYLAGFCLKDAAYCSLLNCASDSNGLGYWLRNSTTTTLVSCGAEANVPRSNIPNNLGIVLAGSTVSPAVPINDIGADNVNYIKGTSYFISGGSYLTLTSPISKDPGGNATATTYPNKRTAHFGFYGSTSNVTITSPRRSGTAPVKYSYRLETLTGSGSPEYITIGETDLTYDPLNPVETADTTMAPVANILDQGKANLFIAGGEDQSATGKMTTVLDPAYHEINNLSATSKLTIPTYDANPDADTDTTIYFNSVDKKLYMWQDGVWYDTCCAQPGPEPDCYFPGGVGNVVTTGASPSTSGTTGQRGAYCQNGDLVFLGTGSSSSGSVGLQSLNLVTNQIVNYPNTSAMRFAHRLVIGYNPNNEKGIYFQAMEVIPGSSGPQVYFFGGDDDYYRSVVGFYNLVTGVCTVGLDTVIEDYSAQTDEALAAYRMLKFDGDDSLHFLSPEDGIIRVSTEDWTTLGIVPFAGEPVSSTGINIHGGGFANGSYIGYDGYYGTYQTETGSTRVAVVTRKSSYPAGLNAQAAIVNIDSGTISFFDSSINVSDANRNTTNLITTDPETGNLFIVNCSLRSIAEFDLDNLTLINEWVIGTTNDILGYPTFYTSNGKRFALFTKYTAESLTVGANVNTSFVSYNLTDEVLDGAVDISSIVPSINTLSGSISVTWWEQGMSNMPNSFQLPPTYSEDSAKVYIFSSCSFNVDAVCKPYHPAG